MILLGKLHKAYEISVYRIKQILDIQINFVLIVF